MLVNLGEVNLESLSPEELFRLRDRTTQLLREHVPPRNECRFTFQGSYRPGKDASPRVARLSTENGKLKRTFIPLRNTGKGTLRLNLGAEYFACDGDFIEEVGIRNEEHSVGVVRQGFICWFYEERTFGQSADQRIADAINGAPDERLIQHLERGRQFVAGHPKAGELEAYGDVIAEWRGLVGKTG